MCVFVKYVTVWNFLDVFCLRRCWGRLQTRSFEEFAHEWIIQMMLTYVFMMFCQLVAMDFSIKNFTFIRSPAFLCVEEGAAWHGCFVGTITARIWRLQRRCNAAIWPTIQTNKKVGSIDILVTLHVLVWVYPYSPNFGYSGSGSCAFAPKTVAANLTVFFSLLRVYMRPRVGFATLKNPKEPKP